MKVYTKHTQWWEKLDQEILPKQALVDDMTKLKKNWLEKGFQILIVSDANAIFTKVKVIKSLQGLGLHKIFLERHSNSAPGIKWTNKYETPTDGIWS